MSRCNRSGDANGRRTVFSCELAYELGGVREPTSDAIDTARRHLSKYKVRQHTEHTSPSHRPIFTSVESAMAASSPALPLMTVACHAERRSCDEDVSGKPNSGAWRCFRLTDGRFLSEPRRADAHRIKHDRFPVDVRIASCGVSTLDISISIMNTDMSRRHSRTDERARRGRRGGGTRTGSEHSVEVLDGPEVDKQAAGHFTQVLHLLWRSRHDGRGAQSERGIGRLRRYNVVRDLSKPSKEN